MQCSRRFCKYKMYFRFQLCTTNNVLFKKIKYIPNEITIQRRLFNLFKESKAKSKVSKSLKRSDKILDYYDSEIYLRELKNKIPPDCLKKRKHPSSMFVVNREVAREMMKLMEPYLKKYNGHILEVNAGPGVLTALLLDAKLPRLRIYEYDAFFRSELQDLIDKHKSDARLFKGNLLSLRSMISLDREDFSDRVGAVFEGLPTLSWTDEPVVKMIMTIPSEAFINHVIYSIIFQSSICAFGRPELFAVMPSSTYYKLTWGPERGFGKYLTKVVLFHIFFEHTVLSTLPAKAFLPWLSKSTNKQKNKTESKKDDEMFFVKITARQDLFERIPPHLIKPFWFFVHTMMHKRKARLIALMEIWIPGCGVRLISMGYTIFTMCGSVLPDEYLELFLEFSSWPEFKTSSFLSNMESLMISMADPGQCEKIMSDPPKESTSEDFDTVEESFHLFDNSLNDYEQQTDCEHLKDEENER